MFRLSTSAGVHPWRRGCVTAAFIALACLGPGTVAHATGLCSVLGRFAGARVLGFVKGLSAAAGIDPPHVVLARTALEQVFPQQCFVGRGQAIGETRAVLIEFCLRRVRDFDSETIARLAAEATRIGGSLDLPLRAMIAGIQSPVLAKVLQAAAEQRRGSDPLVTRTLTQYRHNAPPLGAVRSIEELHAVLASQGLQGVRSIAPHATASVATVYKLEMADGRLLALKLRHPGIKELIARDQRDFAAVLDALDASAKTRWLIGESIGFLEREAAGSEDERAMANARAAYASAGLEWAHVPELLHSVDGLQVMSWAGGRHLNLLPPKEQAPAATRLLQVFFAPWGHPGADGQSSVHCDLHPSNLLGESGADGSLQLHVLDHGLAVTFSKQERDHFIAFTRAMLKPRQRRAAEAAATALAPFVRVASPDGRSGEGAATDHAAAQLEALIQQALAAHAVDRLTALREAILAVGSAEGYLLDPRVAAIGRGIGVVGRAFRELGGSLVSQLTAPGTRTVLAPILR